MKKPKYLDFKVFVSIVCHNHRQVCVVSSKRNEMAINILTYSVKNFILEIKLAVIFLNENLRLPLIVFHYLPLLKRVVT